MANSPTYLHISNSKKQKVYKLLLQELYGQRHTHTGTYESIWSEMIYFMYFLSLCAQGLIIFLGEGNGKPQNKQIKQCSSYVNQFEIVIQKIPDCDRLAASVVNRRQYLKRKAKDRKGENHRRREWLYLHQGMVIACRDGDRWRLI